MIKMSNTLSICNGIVMNSDNKIVCFNRSTFLLYCVQLGTLSSHRLSRVPSMVEKVVVVSGS